MTGNHPWNKQDYARLIKPRVACSSYRGPVRVGGLECGVFPAEVALGWQGAAVARGQPTETREMKMEVAQLTANNVCLCLPASVPGRGRV